MSSPTNSSLGFWMTVDCLLQKVRNSSRRMSSLPLVALCLCGNSNLGCQRQPQSCVYSASLKPVLIGPDTCLEGLLRRDPHF